MAQVNLCQFPHYRRFQRTDVPEIAGGGHPVGIVVDYLVRSLAADGSPITAVIKRTGLTAIHVTHDRAEALAIADRVVILSAGQIHQVAPPAEIISNPATPVVAAFMADATAIPVVVERGSDEVVAQMPGQALRLGVESVDFRGDAVGASEHLMLVAPHHIKVVGADAAADDTSAQASPSPPSPRAE
ncbi:hypothetical protein [Corynebacterium sp.]|uniref:hypothetical protein n=1 Tax=Corynebacterium sp. TaxID=1720 RepID=UPI0039C8B177